MEFPTFFQRRKGGSGSIPLLGSDAANPNSPSIKPPNGDNVLPCRVLDVGNQIHRIAVGYWTAGGSGEDLTAAVWFFDSRQDRWFKCSTGTLKENEITYFRIPYLADSLPTNTQGGALLALIVADPAAADNTFNFVMGPDCGQF